MGTWTDNCRQQVENILSGDSRQFASLVDAHQRLVNHIVFKFVPCEADREDLCQEVFLKVYQHLSRFQHKSKLSTWIARIAYNSCLNFLDKKRLPLFEDTVSDDRTVDDCMAVTIKPDKWVESRQTSIRLCEEIDKLPVRYGLILSLYHLQEMSYTEIGAVLGLPEGTVKSYLFRARRLLRERLKISFAQEELCA
jgi:RNA polymerase sigma factor (sigma-70 family)